MTVPSEIEHLVFEIPEFMSPAFCDHLIDRSMNHGFEPATITSELGTSVAPNIRNNDRVIFDDVLLADKLWQDVSPYFTEPFKGGLAVGLNERFRIYRYIPKQFFDWHQDGEFKSEDGLTSKFTMMVYLNERMEGGGTSFADVFSPHVFADFTIKPKTGKALLFHHPLSHRGDPIVSGEKFVLRTDIMFRSQA